MKVSERLRPTRSTKRMVYNIGRIFALYRYVEVSGMGTVYKINTLRNLFKL